MSTKDETPMEIQFVYQQTGRKKSSGALTASRICGDQSKVLLIDSFDMSFEAFRRRFVRRLYDTGLNQDLFPAEVLSRNLLEMTAAALDWGRPDDEKKTYSGKDQFAFERLMAYHLEQYPDLSPCELTRIIPAKGKKETL